MPKHATTRLSDTYVERAKAKDRIYEIRDSGQRGLVLRVYPTGTKKWIVQLNRSKRTTLGDATLIEIKIARTRARRLMSDHAEGKDIDRNSKIPLKDYLNKQYTDWIDARTKHGERDTKRLVSALGRLGNVRLDKLTHARIDRWLQDRNVAPATRNRELASLKASLSRAVEWNLLELNPAKNVKPIKDNAGKIVRYLDDEERKRLDKALSSFKPEYLAVMVRLVMHTGLRRGEVFALEWHDIDLRAPKLHVRAAVAKSSKDRYIDLNKDAVTILKEWRIRSGRRNGLVFQSPAGTKFRDIKRQWIKLMKAAEIEDFRFHDLRHDFASRLVQAGVDLYRVKELLGHSTIQLTERYSHLKPQNLMDAVSLLETNKGEA